MSQTIDALQDDLDEYVAGEYDAPATDDGGLPVFAPPSDADQINQYLRVLRKLARQRAEIDALAAAELDRIHAWRDDRADGIDERIEFLERQVELWFRQHAEATGTKTLKLPNGTLSVRPGKARVECFDSAAELLAEMFGDAFVRTKTEPDKTAIVSAALQGPAAPDPAPEGYAAYHAVLESGEVLPSVRLLVPTQKAFRVKVAGDE